MSNSNIHTDTLNLAEIAIRLGSIYEREALLDTMLIDAMNMSKADGGSLYLVKEDSLHFLLVKNVSLKLDLGRESALPESFQPIPISEEKATNLCVFAVQKCRSVNIPDVYTNSVFDLEGSKRADSANNYRSISMLTVPIMGSNHKAIGVLQLINAQDKLGNIIPFHHHVQTIVEAIANMAAVSYSNSQLHIQNARLFDSFLSLISAANQYKNPTENKKTIVLNELMQRLSSAITESNTPPYQRTRIDHAHLHEQKLLVWMLGLQSLVGLSSKEDISNISDHFLPSLPIAESTRSLLSKVGAPYSADAPLSLRMLHFVQSITNATANMNHPEEVYQELQKLSASGLLDQNILNIAKSAHIIEHFSS